MTRFTQRCLLACCALLCFTAVAMAQYPVNQLFQIDGNPANSPGYPGSGGDMCTYLNPTTQVTYSAVCDYWDLLNNGENASGTVTHEATQIPPQPDGQWSARTFVPGISATPAFTGGGSKDGLDIPNWAWTAKSTPPKDALNAAYAAAYTAPNNDFVTVFGGDRFSPNGDAFIGIWFFQQTVVPCPQPAGSPNFSACTGVPAGHFSGQHTFKDVLVLSNFTTGGTAPGIQVYEWDTLCTGASKTQNPGDCAGSNLRFVANATSSGSLCGSSGASAAVCAAAGGGVSTWNEGTIASPLFYEGAIDISFLLGSAPCFTSFVEETRSSQSVTAVLKDFLGGGFPVCSFTLSKSCQCNSVDGNTGTFTYGYGGTVKNTGIGTLSDVMVTEHVPGGSDVVYDCGSLAAGVTKNWPAQCSPTTPTTFTSTTKQPTNTADAVAVASGVSIPPSNGTASASCTDPNQVCAPTPGISVSKTCTTALEVANSVVRVKVNYSGSVSNTSTTEALTNVVVNDTIETDSLGHNGIADPANPLLLTGCTSGNGTTTACKLNIGITATYSGSYIPNGNNVLFSDASGFGRAQFFDQAHTSGKGLVSNTAVTDDSVVAMCRACPAGTCPAQ
jgi:hypothetical protein